MTACPDCNRTVPPDANFCPNCGRVLSDQLNDAVDRILDMQPWRRHRARRGNANLAAALFATCALIPLQTILTPDPTWWGPLATIVTLLFAAAWFGVLVVIAKGARRIASALAAAEDRRLAHATRILATIAVVGALVAATCVALANWFPAADAGRAPAIALAVAASIALVIAAHAAARRIDHICAMADPSVWTGRLILAATLAVALVLLASPGVRTLALLAFAVFLAFVVGAWFHRAAARMKRLIAAADAQIPPHH